jgi:uncharacterized membrane protein
MADQQPFLINPYESPSLSAGKAAYETKKEYSGASKNAAARYSSIDILRTLAIQVMVLVHFSENLSGYKLPITGFGAPLFAFLSGVSYFLWVAGQHAKGRSDEEISKVSIRRGLFVFGVGVAFNVLVWLPEETFNWDVLTFIGSALLVLNLARRMPVPLIIFSALMILLVSPALRIQADYPEYWLNKYFEYDFTLSDILSGYFVTGYFPIFPWLAFSLSGFVTATLLFGEEEEPDQKPSSTPQFPRRMIIVGASMFGVSMLALAVRPYLPETIGTYLLGGWTMFPTTIEYALAMIGTSVLLLGLLHWFVDLNPRIDRRGPLLDIAKTFSQYSLTIYLLHHLVHIWPLWIYTVAIGHEDPTELWMKAMTTPMALSLGVAFLVVCFFLMRWIGPDRRFGMEAWMRWLCD